MDEELPRAVREGAGAGRDRNDRARIAAHPGGIASPGLRRMLDPVLGTLVVTLIALVAVGEWIVSPALDLAIAIVAVGVIACLTPTVPRSRLAFILVGAVMSILCVLLDAEWRETIIHGLGIAAFVASFFAALSTLRVAAETSPGIRRCGRFLAQQPPGRRYAALTVGGQLFALLLNYGSIALLGSLATSSARSEPNAEIRNIRIRRMLLAIQRAFISTLPWSPMSFAIAITTTLLPDTSWGAALLPCLVSGALLAGIGYGLDTIFKPPLSGPRPPRQRSEESWTSLAPLLLLLALLMSLAATLHLLSGVRIVGLVIVIVPVVSLLWAALQAREREPVAETAERARTFVTGSLPSYRGELTLLMMAAFIGTVGAHVVGPMAASSGLDLTRVPAPVILVALVWLIPVAGQFGMNPILSVSLFGPLLPSAVEMGVSPTAILVAMTAGWAISGATSPFTATTLLIGSFSGNSALHVGLRWNGPYALLCATALSLWVLIYAYAV